MTIQKMATRRNQFLNCEYAFLWTLIYSSKWTGFDVTVCIRRLCFSAILLWNTWTFGTLTGLEHCFNRKERTEVPSISEKNGGE